MPQIFRARANPLAVTLLIAVPLLVGAVAAGAWLFGRSPYVTQVDKMLQQPVPFSHRHHVAGLGLDCRYCHNGVADSDFAGMPDTKTCMTCHSQVWTNAAMLAPLRESLAQDRPLRWNRVHDMPDFVYFSHRAHVNNGVGCESCHGRVDRMPLTAKQKSLSMAFCLACHRNPAPHLRPESEIFTMGWRRPDAPENLGEQLAESYAVAPPQQLTDCNTCHR